MLNPLHGPARQLDTDPNAGRVFSSVSQQPAKSKIMFEHKQTVSPEVLAALREVERIEIAQATNFVEQAELTLKHVRARWGKDAKRVAELSRKLNTVNARGADLAAEHDRMLKALTATADALESLIR